MPPNPILTCLKPMLQIYIYISEAIQIYSHSMEKLKYCGEGLLKLKIFDSFLDVASLLFPRGRICVNSASIYLDIQTFIVKMTESIKDDRTIQNIDGSRRNP